MHVQRVGASEASALLEPLRSLCLRAKASWGCDDSFLAAFAAKLPSSLVGPGRATLVARSAMAIAGFAVVDDLGERAWLEDLWVEPSSFGQGVGRMLFDAARTLSHELGCSSLEWESDPNAEGFYLKMGAHRFDVRASSIAGEGVLPLMRVDLAEPPPDVATA